MLNKAPMNIIKVERPPGSTSLRIILTDYLRDIGCDAGDCVIVNSENQLRAFKEVKIITIEKYTGGKKDG
jgi:hypothetical protein